MARSSPRSASPTRNPPRRRHNPRPPAAPPAPAAALGTVAGRAQFVVGEDRGPSAVLALTGCGPAMGLLPTAQAYASHPGPPERTFHGAGRHWSPSLSDATSRGNGQSRTHRDQDGAPARQLSPSRSANQLPLPADDLHRMEHHPPTTILGRDVESGQVDDRGLMEGGDAPPLFQAVDAAFDSGARLVCPTVKGGRPAAPQVVAAVIGRELGCPPGYRACAGARGLHGRSTPCRP